MTNDVECRVFGDQLDALVAGTLPSHAVGHLRAHAAACPECATLLRVHEHLAGPSLEALEARVPEGILAGFPDRVMEAVRSADASPGGSGVVAGRIGPRLVPWMAAASLVLLASTGFLGAEVMRLREQAGVLALEVEARRAQVEGLRVAGPPNSRGAVALRTGILPGGLVRGGTVTVADVVELLRGLPADRVVLREDQVRALLRRPGALGRSELRALAGRIPPAGGVTAGDLVAALSEGGIDPESELDAGRLMDLLS